MALFCILCVPKVVKGLGRYLVIVLVRYGICVFGFGVFVESCVVV